MSPVRSKAFVLKGVVALCAAALLLASPVASQPAGDVARNPLSSIVASSLRDSIMSQLLEPEKAEIRVLVHFPGGRGENGRICGEVVEPGPDGARLRTFYSIYTRAGRVLTRFDDMAFEEFLKRDNVFRNCSPRL